MKVKGRKRLSKAIAVFMTVFMLMGMMPQMAFADEAVSTQQVRVVVENSIWTEDNGAPWSGTLADESVDITDDTTLISAINAALQKAGQQKLSDSTQHITDVNGIADGDAGEDCKWKVTINDAAALNALSDYTVAAGKIKNGDVVKVSYEGNVTAASQPQEQETSAGGQQGDGASNTEESGEESDEGDQAKAGDTDSDKSREAKSAEQVAAKATAFAAMFSSVSAANTGNAVRVIVENTVYSKTDGAPWDGRLVDEWVEINEESTMMSCVVAALDKHNYSQTGAESNYITEINGLTAGSAGLFDGWMGTLNDWFTSEGFGMYTVADGTLEAGDEIKIMYSLGMGEDIGGSWNNNEKTLKSLTFSSGSLDNTFDKNTKAYTLTIPKGTESIKVTPTATNKNFLVKTFVGEKEYKRTAAIPVSDGTVIKVICGDPSWPSMNVGDSPAETYTVTVKVNNENKAPSLKAGVSAAVEASVDVAKAYNVDLSGIFEDADGDELSYTVSVDGAKAVAADEKYSFVPDEGKKYTLVFRASDGAAESEEYTVKLTAEKTAVKLESLMIHTGYTPDATNVLLKNPGDSSYDTENVFAADKTAYELGTVTDSSNQLRFRAKANDAAAKVMLYYGDDDRKDITWSSGSSKFANMLAAGKNTFTIVVEPADEKTQEKTTYTFTIDQLPTLTSLAASTEGTPLYFNKDFKADVKEYTLTVPQDADTVEFEATPKKAEYKLLYNDAESSKVKVRGKDTVEIKVSAGEGEKELINTYTVKLNKVDSIGAFFKVSPEDAVVKVYDQEGMSIYPDETGVFKGMFAAQEYTYVVTKYGYVAKSGKVPAAGGMIEVTLEKAPDDGLKDVDSDWKNFRGSDENMGITDAKTPVSKDDTSKLWNAKLGSGWSAAPSVQIIVDDALIVMSGKELFKLDLETGEILKKGTMTAAPNFGYTPPTYAEGMIFCPLTGGTIQAFNAETLESLWIYKDSTGGQSLSPITYSEGYIYTGFWNSEVKDANYVCLSVTDEDPTKPDEAKLATWKQGQQGGFYWAGSVAVGNAVIFGTDDGAGGTAGDSMLYSLDKKTGNVISSIELKGMGDQRSSMAYDKNSGRVFFTTKGGFLCSAAVNASTGQLSDLKSVDHNAQSTSTPIVYKGKVYFATGSGISSTGSSGNIVVADAKSLEMLYAVGLKGYPQCSLLMSTAYEDETGYIYLYSTYNNRPGGISMLKVKPDAMTAAEAELIELYDAEGFEQFCITSIICGKDGTLYYKNDSGNVFAIGVPDVTVVKNLIDKIGEPQSITLDSRYDIEDAREAYEALDETEKTEVPNYDNLVAAENRLNELQIENVEALIDDIGTVTLSGEEKINAARAAYDALTDEQKAEVSNYDKLTEAEKTLKKLKEEQAAAAEQQNKPAKENNTSSTKVVTKSANIKLKDEKVTEEQLEKGRENHYDSATGIDVSGNSNDILPWYVKMTVEEKSLTKKQESEVKKALGEDCKIFMFKDIHFTDTNTGEEWQPGEPIKVRMPAVDMEGYKNLVIIHISDDGKIELINAEVKNGMIEFEATGFSLYGIAGTNTSIDKMMAPEAEEPVVWPWILIGAIALVIIAIIAIRKKSARE